MNPIQILSSLVILYPPSGIFQSSGNKASPSFKPLNRKLSGEILTYEDYCSFHLNMFLLVQLVSRVFQAEREYMIFPS
jgi:hypothetical protein